MVVGVSAHVRNAHSKAIAHADDAELRDRVLFEELGDEVAGVADGEEVAGGSEVFLLHCDGEVEDEDYMADNASLERGGVLQESAELQSAIITPLAVLLDCGMDDLCLFPACSSPSTVLVIVPSAPSVRFSHVRVTSKPEDSLFARVDFERVPDCASRLDEGITMSSSEPST